MPLEKQINPENFPVERSEKEQAAFDKKLRLFSELNTGFEPLPCQLRQRVIDKAFPGGNFEVPAFPENEELRLKKEMADENARIGMMDYYFLQLKSADAEETKNKVANYSNPEFAADYYNRLMETVWSNRFREQKDYQYFHEQKFAEEDMKADLIKGKMEQAWQALEQKKAELQATKKPHRKRELETEIFNLNEKFAEAEKEYLPYRLGEALSRSPLKTKQAEMLSTENATVLAEFMTPEEFAASASKIFGYDHRHRIVQEYLKSPGQPVIDNFWGEVSPERIEVWRNYFKRLNQTVSDWYEKHQADQPPDTINE